MAVLCMLYKIRCNPMYPLYGALPVPAVPVPVRRGALIAHWYCSLLAAVPRSSAGPFFTSKCPCGTVLLILYSMVWDWRVSRARPMLFYWPKLLYPFLSSTIFIFLFFHSIGWYCGAGVFGLVSPSLALPTT